MFFSTSVTRITAISVVGVLLSFTPALADQRAVHDLLRKFGNKIYTIAEITGGSDAEWAEAEQDALDKLAEIALENPDALVMKDKHNTTPLMLASGLGYAFFVEQLLSYKFVTDQVEALDDEGFTAYGYSLVAGKRTLHVCWPDLDKTGFVFFPFFAAQPYYENRAPYAKISNLLIKKGVEPDERHAKSKWLEGCTGARADFRERVEASTDLQADLLAISRDAPIPYRHSERRDRLKELISILKWTNSLSAEKASQCMTEINSHAAPPMTLRCLEP